MKITLDLDINDLTGKDIRVLKAIIDTSALQEVRISSPAVAAEVLKPEPAPAVIPQPVAPEYVPTREVKAPVEIPTPPVAAPQPVVPAPPPASVVTAVEPPVVPAAQTIETDSAGVPWDEEIHSSGKSKISDGTWKRKRGVDDETYNNRVRELLGLTADTAPTVPAVPAVPPANVPSSWTELLRLITPKVTGANAEIKPDTINAWLTARGVEGGFGVLARRADLYPEFCEAFGLC